MQTIRCHCCGAILGDVPELSRLRHVLTKKEFQIVEIIHEAKEAGIGVKDIALKLFGERIGLQEVKFHEVRVFMTRILPKIEQYGFYIQKGNRWNKLYRLQPLEVAA